MIIGDVDLHKDIRIEVEYWNLKRDSQLSIKIHQKDSSGVCVHTSANFPSASIVIDPWFNRTYPRGQFKTHCCIPRIFLNEGTDWVNAIILNNVTRFEAQFNDAISFNVQDADQMCKEYDGGWIGLVHPKFAWNTEYPKPIESII